jgi:ribosomal protein S18 acetylase RimI-like enzyme
MSTPRTESEAPAGARIRVVETVDGMKSPSVDELAEFLHENMKPYEDTVPDVKRGILDALERDTGFVVIAEEEKDSRLLGALVMVPTLAKGYMPSNMLLFVGVHPDTRGRGIGGALCREGLSRCEGGVKLHVEYDNPAKRLYERLGFTTKYAEMRYDT